MAYEKIKQNVMAICSSLYLNSNYKVIPHPSCSSELEISRFFSDLLKF